MLYAIRLYAYALSILRSVMPENGPFARRMRVIGKSRVGGKPERFIERTVKWSIPKGQERSIGIKAFEKNRLEAG